jgi:DNA-binding transcriptional regulator YiaG
VATMPDTSNGREKINNYLKANEISISSLAKMYGISKQDMADYLAGRKKNPAANRTILKIISDFNLS